MLSETRARRCRRNAREHLVSNPQLSLHNSMQLLEAGSGDADALDLATTALLALRRYAMAAPLLKQLHNQYAPGIRVLEDLVSCYTATANITALTELRTEVVALGDADIAALLLKIRLLNALNQHLECMPLCEELLERRAREPEYWCMLAWHQQSCGQLEAAAGSYETALKIAPDHVRAHYALAYVQKATAQSSHIEALCSSLDHIGSERHYDRASLHSALGKEYEDLGDYSAAFQQFQASAELMRPFGRYGAETDQHVLAATGSWVEKQLLPQVPAGWEDSRPVFIIGLPRTGSTLLDHMLSSHSEVESAGELLCFRAAVQELYGATSRGDFFEEFFDNDQLQLDFAAIGQRYCQLSAGAAGSSRHYTDKMPMNYFLAGVIALALPEARFIHTVRNPMDSCFSIYKQLFGQNYYNFSYHLEDVARHFAHYQQLMARWHRCFPGRILDVHYEDLVTEPREQLTRVLEHCGLDWQESCLHPHLNNAAVDTASAAQIRQPLYQTSVEKWRHYSEYLQPLANTLESAGVKLERSP